MEADSAGTTQVGVSPETAAEDGNGAAGGGESVPVGHDGSGIGELLSGAPSDTVPVATGTYALFHATDGSVVLVLEDSIVGVKTLAIPRAVVTMMGSGGRPSWKSLPKLLRGNRG